MTANEARKILGLPAVENGDELRTPEKKEDINTENNTL